MAKRNGVEAAPAARPRLMKRFKFPARCDVREVVVRELDGNDDEQISILADARAEGPQRDSLALMAQVENREAMRAALVEVDGVRVNLDGVPYAEMDDWSIRTMRFMQLAFGEVNGVTGDEAEGFKKAAEVVVAGAAAETIEPAAPRSIARNAG